MRCHLGHGLTGELPAGWDIRNDEDFVELELPDGLGAVHISILRRPVPRLSGLLRRGPRPPKPGEAEKLMGIFPPWREARERGPVESTSTASELRAHGQCVDTKGTHWDIGVRVGRTRALVFSFTPENPDGPERELARQLFTSIDGLEISDAAWRSQEAVGGSAPAARGSVPGSH